ncbi:MAG TPA: hypothetical protein VL860_12270 [Planctomycetota bacterium]|nr:hypothetical protein [Planctomycetota bacterium]
MKKWMRNFVLALLITAASLTFLPQPAMASLQQPVRVELPGPEPVVVPPTPPDFSDAEFEQADQPEMGKFHGGEVIIIFWGGLVVLLIVILLILLILHLL